MNTLVLLLYRIGAFISHVSKNLSQKNKAENELQTENMTWESYIESQSSLSTFSIGKRTLSYSGCGVIAVYNVLVALGKNTNKNLLFNLISDFEKNGLVFSGKYGISPTSIYNYIKKLGFTSKAIKTSDIHKINDFSNSFDCFISIFYNKEKDIKSGLHYVAISKDLTNGLPTFTSHNPNMIDSTLSETIKKASYNVGTPLYTIGIKNGKN